MEHVKVTFQKIIYGSIFCIILPLLLIFWAYKTNAIIHLPVPNFPLVFLAMTTIGFLMIIWAMYNLWNKGKGLPMNAFPPQNYVSTGLYHLFHHPIYVGAILMSYGISGYFQSASGFWFVSPTFMLLIICYIIGFENEIISKVFENKNHKTFFDFPDDNNENTRLKNKLLIYIWVYIPWLLIYESFIFIGKPMDAIATNISWDAKIPFMDFTVIPYILLYPLAIFIPFILNKNREVRSFIFDLISGMVVIFYCYLSFPFVIDYQPIDNTNIFTQLIIWGRETDGVVCALPSFHVFWALIVSKYYSKAFPKAKLIFAIIGWAITISCLTTKNHTILDVIFGITAYYIVHHRKKIYEYLIQGCENISNSWKEWRIGKIRIINHGFYAALGGISGFLIIGYFLPNHLPLVYLIGISGFVGAGLWAQFIEGSPMLLRPFGYYGSVIGMGLTIILISIFSDYSFWYVVAISTLAASSIQFFGRFRCLVQGCCHGKPTDQVLGIKFCHPKSRVHKIAGWSGKNLYPTQFYSIACNLLTLFFLFRLVSLEMPCAFIAGMYLILNGSFRFVEESLRGEPQTPYFMGIRVYQWLALLSIFIGISFTCVESETLSTGCFSFSLVLNALIYGFLVLFAYGIDFPESNQRFSRLTQ